MFPIGIILLWMGPCWAVLTGRPNLALTVPARPWRRSGRRSGERFDIRSPEKRSGTQHNIRYRTL